MPYQVVGLSAGVPRLGERATTFHSIVEVPIIEIRTLPRRGCRRQCGHLRVNGRGRPRVVSLPVCRRLSDYRIFLERGMRLSGRSSGWRPSFAESQLQFFRPYGCPGQQKGNPTVTSIDSSVCISTTDVPDSASGSNGSTL